MYFVILLVIIAYFGLLAWSMIHSASWMLSMFLPRALGLGLGGALLVYGLFISFASARVLHDPASMLGGFLPAFAGFWLILAPSAINRGTTHDQQMLQRMFIMMGLVVVALLAALYIHDLRSLGVVYLLLISAALWVTANYLDTLNRSR